MAARVAYQVPAITPESRLRFRELTVVREKNADPMLGCQQVKTFVEVDDDTLRAIDAMKLAQTLKEAQAELLAQTGEDYDLVDLAQFLAARGFVESVDGEPVKASSDAYEKSHFAWIRTEWVKWYHHPALLGAVGFVALAGILAMLAKPSLAPRYSDLFVVDQPALVMIIAFVAMFANTFVHEMSHLVMARSYGVASSIRMSNRLHIVVMETDVTNAWTLPARQRVLIFLAGMGYNIVMLSACILALGLAGEGIISLSSGWIATIRFFAFMNMIPITFQFLVFMRTDLYFVALCITGERNLLQDSKAYLGYALRRSFLFVRGKFDASCDGCSRKLHASDPFCHGCGQKRVATDPHRYPFNPKARHIYLGYGTIMAIAMPWMLSRMFKFLVYFQVEALRRSLGRLLSAWPTHDTWVVLGAGLSLALVVAQLSLMLYFVIPMLWRWIKKGAALAGRTLKWGMGRAGVQTPRPIETYARGGLRRSTLAIIVVALAIGVTGALGAPSHAAPEGAGHAPSLVVALPPVAACDGDAPSADTSLSARCAGLPEAQASWTRI